MIAWQATIKPKVRFISFQTKIQPSFTRTRRDSVSDNEAFCDHYTLNLNNRNGTTAASGDSAKTFAPPGFGQRSQLPSRVRRESGPGFIIWPQLATWDFAQTRAANTKYSDFLWSFATRDTLQTSTMREREPNCCTDTSRNKEAVFVFIKKKHVLLSALWVLSDIAFNVLFSFCQVCLMAKHLPHRFH